MNNPRFTPGEIVIVKRDDRGGDRIPHHYRQYITETTYIYKAIVLELYPTKAYNRVQPIPWDQQESRLYLRRKGYKSKMYKLTR